MIQIEADTLYERLKFVDNGTMRQSGGMYSLVCVERVGDTVFFRAFNHVAHSLAKVKDEPGKPFRLLFDPSPLLNALSRVSGPLSVEIDVEGHRIIINGPVSLKHSCVDGEDFIDFPEQTVDPVNLRGGNTLSGAIAKAGNAVEENNPNPRFAGIYLGDRHTPGTVCCVGANTTGLIEVEMGNASAAENFEGESIIPAQALKQIRGVLESESKPNLYLGEREASFVGDDLAVCTMLIAEKYPNYPAIMPDEDNCQPVEMDRKEFEKALRICQEYTEDFSSTYLDFDADNLRVSSPESEGGAASYDLMIETTEMGRMRLKCSSERMLNVVRAMSGPRVTMFVPIEEMPTRVGMKGGEDSITGAVALMRLQPHEQLEEQPPTREPVPA